MLLKIDSWVVVVVAGVEDVNEAKIASAVDGLVAISSVVEARKVDVDGISVVVDVVAAVGNRVVEVVLVMNFFSLRIIVVDSNVVVVVGNSVVVVSVK